MKGDTQGPKGAGNFLGGGPPRIIPARWLRLSPLRSGSRLRGRFLLISVGLGAVGALSSALFAAQPGWWTAPATRIIDDAPGVSHGVSANYATVNLGQLKNAAKMAKAHLDATLPGQAGPQIDALVAGFANVPADNYAPANLGQLKAVAKPFYDRLIAAGYDTRANLVAHGFPGAGVYPWNPATPAVDNYAPANLGQLKMAFSFSVSGDPFNGGPPPPVQPSPGGDGANIILTWSSGLGIASYTVERWQNGAWVTVSTTPGSGPGSSAHPHVTDQSTAGGGSSNLAPGMIYLYRVTANATNGSSSSSNVEGAVVNPDENNDTDALTNGEEVDAGYYCKELGEGEIDEGTLEMGGNPAGWVGPDPKLDDTDMDGVKDDTDGWANNPDISTAPRLPAVRYAAIAIDEMGFPSDYTPIAVNDKCQVVGYKEDPEDPYAEFDYVFWDIKTGQATAIDLDGVPQKGGLNNSGVVCGVVNTNGDQVAAKWTKDGGQELLDPVVPAVLSGYEEKTFTPYVLGINDDGEVVGSEYYSGWNSEEAGWNSEEEELVGSREGASAVICGQSLFGPTQYVTSEYNPTSYSIDGEKHFVPKMIKNGLTIGTVASYYPEEDNPLEDEGFSAIYDSELKVLDEFDVATAVNDAGYVVGQHQESGSPDNGKFYLWTKKNGAWKKGDLIPGLNYDQPAYVNNRLEVTDYQNLTIIRNGVPLGIPDLLGSPWLGYGLINGFNNLGVIVTEGTPVAGQSHKYLLVPINISYQAHGDNEPLSDNKKKVLDGSGGLKDEWMPGHGKRVFPDNRTGTDTTSRNSVDVKVETGCQTQKFTFWRSMSMTRRRMKSILIKSLIPMTE